MNQTSHSTFLKSTDLVDVLNLWNCDIYSGDVNLLRLVLHNIHLLLFLLTFLFNLNNKNKYIYFIYFPKKSTPLCPSSLKSFISSVCFCGEHKMWMLSTFLLRTLKIISYYLNRVCLVHNSTQKNFKPFKLMTKKQRYLANWYSLR